MSGLVPLQADIMRYLESDLCSYFQHDDILWKCLGFCTKRLHLERRTEIGLQAASFGADIQSKYVYELLRFGMLGLLVAGSTERLPIWLPRQAELALTKFDKLRNTRILKSSISFGF